MLGWSGPIPGWGGSPAGSSRWAGCALCAACTAPMNDDRRCSPSRARDLWLDCLTQQEIADAIGVSIGTVNGWVSDSDWQSNFEQAPESRQHFDIKRGSRPGQRSDSKAGKAASCFHRNLWKQRLTHKKRTDLEPEPMLAQVDKGVKTPRQDGRGSYQHTHINGSPCQMDDQSYMPMSDRLPSCHQIGWILLLFENWFVPKFRMGKGGCTGGDRARVRETSP